MIVDTDDLVNSADIARLAHVTRAAVTNWKSRHADFPKPVFAHGLTKLYLWSQVREWLSVDRTYEVVIPARPERTITHTLPARFPPKETP